MQRFWACAVKSIRQFCHELVYTVPLLAAIWLLASYLSRNNRYSYFFRPQDARLFKQHEMYRETCQTAWRDLLAYAKEKRIARIFDKSSDELCVGVLTVARTRAMERRYLTGVMMSLVARIPWHFQDRVSIRIFNMDARPEAHAEANELAKLFRVDLPVYPEGVRLPEKGTEMHHIGKENLDYLAAMRALGHCRYALILEDDALASRNWYTRTVELIAMIPKDVRWLYMKLFVTYKWMGWGKEAAHVVTLVAFGLAAALLASLLVGTFLHRWEGYASVDGKSRPIAPRFTGPLSIALLFGYFVVLFHCIGRQHLLPPGRGVQVHPLNAAMVATLYPRDELGRLADYYEQMLRGQSGAAHPYYLLKDNVPYRHRMNSRLEELIAVPSVFQHTGVHSSMNFRSISTAAGLTLSTDFPDDDEPIRFSRVLAEQPVGRQ